MRGFDTLETSAEVQQAFVSEDGERRDRKKWQIASWS